MGHWLADSDSAISLVTGAILSFAEMCCGSALTSQAESRLDVLGAVDHSAIAIGNWN
jgi:hypothetical protein